MRQLVFGARTLFGIALFGIALCGAMLVPWATLAAQTFEGFTEPARSIDVAAGDTGPVATVQVRRGDQVRQGDLLVVLDHQVLAAARRVAQKKADNATRLQALEVELQVKRNRHQQLQELLDQNAGNPEEVRRAAADVEVAELSVQAALEDRELAQLQLAEIDARMEQRRVRSPVDGVVIDVIKEPGEYVSTLEPHVATVVQLNALRATFYPPTETAIRLRVDEHVTLDFPEQEQRAEGRIEYIGAVTEADSGRVRVNVLIANEQQSLRSGVRCRLTIDP